MTTTLQTRIPSFLWTALQDVFYEQDVAFLRALSPHIQVPLQELKRTLLGTRGVVTTLQVGQTDAWWETEFCPLRIRDASGIWRQCGHYREGTGFCRTHRDFWEGTTDLKHKDDPWFQTVNQRVPWRYQDELVWVSKDGDVIHGDGRPFPEIRICPTSGVLSHEAVAEG